MKRQICKNKIETEKTEVKAGESLRENKLTQKVLRVDLKEFFDVLYQKPEKEYAIAVIDNAGPDKSVIGSSFLWLKSNLYSTDRGNIESIFKTHNVPVKENQPIAVFHHHDLKEPYVNISKDNIEFYEFSHYSNIVNEAFDIPDSKLLSHILSKTFHKYDKIVLVKSNEKEIVNQLQQKYEFLDFDEEDLKEIKKKGFSKEEYLMYKVAMFVGPKSVVPDPRRYRPEVHDEIIKSGVPVVMYSVPSLVKEVEIETGTQLDKEVTKRTSEIKENWKKEIEVLKKEKEAEIAKTAEEDELRSRGELLESDAKDHVKSIAPSLGCDYTYDPVYPKTRKDVAAVRHMAENGSSYGYDTIYLVWRTKGGTIEAKELINSASTKDYMHIDSVTETKDSIIVKIRSGGSYSGKAWEKTIEVSKREIDTKKGNGKKADQKKSILARHIKGSAAEADWISKISPEAGKYLGVTVDQLTRLDQVICGEKTKGEEILESLYKDAVEQLSKKYPALIPEVRSRVSIIAEGYDGKLVQETFKLLDEIEGERFVGAAIHILSEMAMLHNSSENYSRVVSLLERNAKNEKILSEILYDNRLEFKPDYEIEKALEDYEKK